MKKRIYGNMLYLTLASVVLVSVLLIFTFYTLFIGQVKNELKSEAALLQSSLYYTDDNLSYMRSLDLSGTDIRVSIIAQNGVVLFDSFEDASELENHKDRAEIQSAFQAGTGESNRFSTTLGSKTYYYALKIDENSVLRLAKTTSSIYGISIASIPVILLILLIIFAVSQLLAVRLTKKIIEPINKIDLDSKDIAAYDELSPFIRTITRQKEQIEQQFIALENRARTINAITDNMKEGLILLDKKGIILSANKSSLSLFEAKKNYEGKHIVELTRKVEFLENVKRALSGDSCDSILERGGKCYAVFFNPVLESGVLILFLDITEKSKAEKMRREFSANVSHELKTPLTTIMGLSEMMSNDMVKEEDVNHFAGKIKEEASGLIQLIEDIIMLSQLDEAAGIKEPDCFNLSALLAEVVESLKLNAANNSVTVEAACAVQMIKASRRMIYEMLFNLIDNAIKYNRPGGKVSVSIYNENDTINIIVSDTGIGIPKDHKDRIFERFYRVDKSRSKKTGGTGLGLSIVKHVVQYHGGTVEIESKEGMGTSMTVKMKAVSGENGSS